MSAVLCASVYELVRAEHPGTEEPFFVLVVVSNSGLDIHSNMPDHGSVEVLKMACERHGKVTPTRTKRHIVAPGGKS
jgi:hypothetical protein